MPIQVGDAVFRFLADTQELDRAYQQLEMFPEVADPVNVELKEVAGNWTFMGRASSTAAVETTIAAEQIVEAGHHMAGSYREARGEAMLLGEATGIHLPRHVTSFLATMPGVQGALSSAFAATAVLFLIEALIKGTEKLSNWIGGMFIYTKAMKDAEAANLLMNTSLIEQGVNLQKAKEQLESFAPGLNAVTAVQKQIDELSKSMKETADASLAAHNVIGLYNLGLGHTAAEASKAKDELVLLGKQQTTQMVQMDVLTLQMQAAESAEALKKANERIALEKVKYDSLIGLQKAYSLSYIAGTSGEADAVQAIEAMFAEKAYHFQLAQLEQKLHAQETFNSRDIVAINTLHAEIEALERGHSAKLIEEGIKVAAELAAANKALGASTIEVHNEIVNNNPFQEMMEAADKLGITLKTQLGAGLMDTVKNYEQLKNSGVASLSDLLQAQMKVLQATIAYDKAVGNTSGAQAAKRDLQDITNQYDKLTGAVDKNVGHVNVMMKLFQKDVKDAGNQTKFFADIGKDSLTSFANAAGSAFDSFLKGQDSFGAAMKKATVATLDSLASQAFANALYYGAMGIADTYWNPLRAGADFAAAGQFAAMAALFGAAGAGLGAGGSGGGGSAASTTQNLYTSSNTSGGGQGGGVNTTGVQRFASGGIATQRTLAMVGDDEHGTGNATEGILPLDDPKAMAMVGKAVAQHIIAAGGGRDGINVHVAGLISPDNLKRVVGQMNTMVGRGQTSLQASRSFQVTRRG